MNEVRLAGQRLGVTSATLQLYHQHAEVGDWNLDIATDDAAIPRVLLSGTMRQSSGQLTLAFVDQPDVVSLDGRAGCLTTSDATAPLDRVDWQAGGFHITGTLRLWWNAVEEGVQPSTREYVIELDLHSSLMD